MAERLIAAAILTSFLALSLSFPAQVVTSAECSAKFKAAQSAGTAGNMKYADFRKAECGTGASATPAAAPAAKPAATPTAQAPARPPVATGGAVFPTAMSTKYSTESAGKQRMHTCLDQYNANKSTNSNGSLNWIQKGGGYYSQCNARLKG
jgi:hypothetical protein